MKLLCDVYTGSVNPQMYLFVSKQDGLTRVPELLMQRFGKPKLAMTMVLHKGRKLAKVEVEKVIKSIEEQGFYLQLPPQGEDYMQDIHQHNDKMPRF